MRDTESAPAAASTRDFIEVYEDVLHPEICDQVIHLFLRSGQREPGRVGGGYFPALKHSTDLTISGRRQWQAIESQLNEVVLQALCAYVRRYPYVVLGPFWLRRGAPPRHDDPALTPLDLTGMDESELSELVHTCFRPGPINLQHYTSDVGGYPRWHCELYPRDETCEHLHRHLLWTLYLNDAFMAGETEFLHQGRVIRPKTGALLLAPAAFTHTHRGNVPVGGDKFIATSWVLFQRAGATAGNPPTR